MMQDVNYMWFYPEGDGYPEYIMVPAMITYTGKRDLAADKITAEFYDDDIMFTL